MAAADAIFGRIAIYGVAIFYVLSGLTLYHVYEKRLAAGDSAALKQFAKKRLVRLYPLLWVVTLITIYLNAIKPSAMGLFLNLTGLFGFVAPSEYYAYGAWSIGNELVFYFFLPLFFYCMRTAKALFAMMAVAVIAVFVYFAFFVLQPNIPLIQQWPAYVNPLNNLFFFFGGFCIGLFFKQKIFSGWQLILVFVGALLLFNISPVQYSQTSELVTGFNRIGLAAATLGLCFVFYKRVLQLPFFIHRLFISVGSASYAIYILHPITHTLTGTAFLLSARYLIALPAQLKLPAAVVFTFVAAYLINRNFEKLIKRFVSTASVVVIKKAPRKRGSLEKEKAIVRTLS